MNEFLTVNGGDLRICCNVYSQKQGDQPGTGYKQILWQISRYDWCSLSKLGRIADNRDVVGKLISDYERESLSYPAGKVFHIAVKVIPHNSFINSLFPSSKEVRVEIDTQKVSKLEGVISDFILVMGQVVLSFNTKGIKIESCA